MKILIIPPTLNYENLGDIALVLTAVKRLREFVPRASLYTLVGSASAEAALSAHVPDVNPVRYSSAWFNDTFLLGPVHKLLPRRLTRVLAASKQALYRQSAALAQTTISLRLLRNSQSRSALQQFFECIRGADAVVAAGAGGLNDLFASYSRMLLSSLELAQGLGKPTALFSHGLGPLRDRPLFARATRVFRRLEVVALRESREGAPLVRAMGVAPHRIHVTGDDAVQLARVAAVPKLGADLGINFRLGSLTRASEHFARELGHHVRRFAVSHKARLVPLPIATHDHEDARAIAAVLDDPASSGAEDYGVASPNDVIQRAKGCRLVITAAYHAAVFALSQGVPSICLAASEYFGLKFAGLSEHFGDGCRVVDVADDGAVLRVMELLDETWLAADRYRSDLLGCAARQIRASMDAYHTFASALLHRQASTLAAHEQADTLGALGST